MVRSFASTRDKFITLGFAMVALFTLYGFFGPGLKNQIHGFPFDWLYALGAAIYHMALGICIATCLVVGVIVCIEVRTNDAERKIAIATLIGSSIAASVVPTLLLICTGLFHGGGLILSEALLTATISLLSFLTFAGFVLSVAER